MAAEGKIIIVTGRGDPARLGSVGTVRAFLNNLVESIGMRPLDEPSIFDVPLQIEKLGAEPFEDEGGVSGTIIGSVVLSTSHIALHTWPLRGSLTMTAYSCRDFDETVVKERLQSFFDAVAIKSTDVSHALDYSS